MLATIPKSEHKMDDPHLITRQKVYFLGVSGIWFVHPVIGCSLYSEHLKTGHSNTGQICVLFSNGKSSLDHLISGPVFEWYR